MVNNIRRASLFSVFLFVLACTPARQSTLSSAAENRGSGPNIVVLFCDDLGYGDLSGLGHPTIKTPHLDRMAGQGMKLTNFYSGSPACTASRYSLLTGRYPVRSGFSWVLNPNSPRGIHPNERTIAEELKEAGYATAIFGKWHLGTTKREYLPLQNGFDEYTGLPYSNDMIPPKFPPIALMQGNDTLEMGPDQTKLTALYTEKAISFIERHTKQPFFLYVPFAMPHVPLHPGKEFAGTSLRGVYGDVVEEIDNSVGKILQTLVKQGLDKNTLVVFTSDNGPWIIKGAEGGSAGLFRDGKGSTWEGGMRVPAIVYWPGKIPAGTLNATRTSTLDLYPTLLRLAGRELPGGRTIDGRDISQVLFDNTSSQEERVFFFYGSRNTVHAVRKGKWKLHIHTSSQTGADYFNGKLPLLFDLENDPSEKYDLSDKHPDIVKDLQAEIRIQDEAVSRESNFFARDAQVE